MAYWVGTPGLATQIFGRNAYVGWKWMCLIRNFLFWSLRKMQKQKFASEIDRVTLCYKVCSCKICRALNVKPLLRIERSQLCWFGHVFRMPHEKLVRQVLMAKLMGKWPRGHQRTRWSDYISDLDWCHLGVELAELPMMLLLTMRYFESY